MEGPTEPRLCQGGAGVFGIHTGFKPRQRHSPTSWSPLASLVTAGGGGAGHPLPTRSLPTAAWQQADAEHAGTGGTGPKFLSCTSPSQAPARKTDLLLRPHPGRQRRSRQSQGARQPRGSRAGKRGSHLLATAAVLRDGAQGARRSQISAQAWEGDPCPYDSRTGSSQAPTPKAKVAPIHLQAGPASRILSAVQTSPALVSPARTSSLRLPCQHPGLC